MERGEDRALGLLVLLPAACLLWPFAGAPLADDPFPHLGGAGWAELVRHPEDNPREVMPAAIAALSLRKSRRVLGGCSFKGMNVAAAVLSRGYTLIILM